MDVGVWEAARSVRPYLEELVGLAAGEVDEQLVGLLNSGDTGQEAENRLRAVLEAHEETRVFFEEVLEDAPEYRPPMLPDQNKGLSPLPGHEPPISADKYSCPQGDYVWYLPEVGTKIRSCPTHHRVLEPA